MPERRPPSHLLRAKLASRAKILFAIASAGFVLYRLGMSLYGKGH
ncbi:MAG TPA: hypothetical protein VJV78_33935 [Polyangiales bacterium]|nr:hypothetical protein [Polyangiales bacterium]